MSKIPRKPRRKAIKPRIYAPPKTPAGRFQALRLLLELGFISRHRHLALLKFPDLEE